MATFENLPNFRQAGGVGLTNKHGQRVKDGLLYRSSRTDFITSKDKSLFLQLGIKSIVDLRRQTEFERADGEKLLQSLYPVWVVKKGEVKQLKPSRRWGKKEGSQQTEDDPNSIGRRYLVNMWTMEFIWSIFKQLNFIIRWMSLVLALIDWFIGSHIFVKLYAKLVMNHQSVTQQYLNILDYTKPAIVDVLRLMNQDDNLPMLMHCAHGKDRTGLIVAIFLGLLEVNEQDIVTDYAESEVNVVFKDN